MAGDTDFDKVILLLKGNGADGSTSIVDSSSYARAVTAFGNASISTAQSKFDGASIAFDGTGDYLSTPYNSNLDFGSGDFTVEAWIYPTTLSGIKVIATSRGLTTDDGGFLFYTNGSSLTALCWGPTAATSMGSAISASGTLVTNAWQHVVFCRSGSTFRVFVGGTVGTTTATSSASVYVNSRPLYVGRDPSTGGRDFQGYIDDLRITKGLARYTTNFTPPTAGFPTSGPVASGSLSAAETDSDGLASSGKVIAKGTISVTEAGVDVAAFAGAAVSQGALGAAEAGSDAMDATGVAPISRQGTLTAAESGGDALNATGSAPNAAGALAAIESGTDAMAATGGTPALSGSLAATESGSDAASISVSTLIAGAMSAIESGVDVMAAQGALPKSLGSLTATESGGDSLSASGALLVRALLAAIEAGEDTAAIAGQIASGGVLTAVETGQDTFLAIESAPAPALDPSRTLVVPVEVRLMRAVGEARAFVVMREGRTNTISQEGRVFAVRV